ncbi:MAG: hypothetical protein ACREMK_09145 [Gemmatimonadota bacterium]
MSGLPASGEMPRTIAIDAHAHLRRCFDLASSLDHAAANFSRASVSPPLGVLLLAETAGCLRFEDLVALSRDPWGDWVFEHTREPGSLVARHRSGTLLLLIAGRQIVTRERLEVLSLASPARIEDGLPIDEVIGTAREAGAIVVLPWGFGKWWGRRGEIVRRIVDEARPGKLFLGDNRNRPQLAPGPALFREAEARGIGVLPGSDPLPFPAHVRNLGRYGFLLPAELERKTPAEELKRILRQARPSPSPIGRRVNPLRFLGDQIRLRAGG